MKYRDQIQVLRQRVPVGVQEGLNFLEKADGDVVQAELLFKKELVEKVISLAGVDAGIADWYLLKTNYDVPAALKNIDEDFLTLTKRVLRRYRGDKESGLDVIVHGIEQVHDLTRPDSWLDWDEINRLPREVACVTWTVEWLNCAGYEGLQYAIGYHSTEIESLLRDELACPDLAQTVHELRTLDPDVLETFEWRALQERFREQLPVLFDILYDYVEKHIDKFP